MSTVAAQDAPSVEFNKAYGGGGFDGATSVIEASDGGFAIAGYTDSFGAGQNDVWLIKTDSNGNVEFNKTYGGADDDVAWSIVETSDGGFALAGRTESFGAGSLDAWLIKTDSKGNVEFNKTYGGGYDDAASSVVETSDGGFAIAGRTNPSGAGQNDAWLIRADSNGNVEFIKTFGGYASDGAESVVQTSDGGFAIAGFTESSGSGARDAWLVKTDSKGNVEFNKTYGGKDFDYVNSLAETSDGFALAGNTKSFGGSDEGVWLIKTDSNGNVQFNKTYGDANEDVALSLVETSDRGFALGAITESSDTENLDALLIKTDSKGNVELNETYGGKGSAYVNSLLETSGGFAIAGRTAPFGAGQEDAWLLKLSGNESGNGGGEGQGLPGFTVVTALLAILTAAVVAAKRRTE